MRVPNRVFHEWCNILIQCQSDRSMKNTLPTIAQKFSDVRVVQSELESMMQGPRREAITMMFLVIANVPLLYFLERRLVPYPAFHHAGKNRPGDLRGHYSVCPDADHEAEQAHRIRR